MGGGIEGGMERGIEGGIQGGNEWGLDGDGVRDRGRDFTVLNTPGNHDLSVVNSAGSQVSFLWLSF
jgi:3',5'-cyclic AMP phosphodiesterase CpdA